MSPIEKSNQIQKLKGLRFSTAGIEGRVSRELSLRRKVKTLKYYRLTSFFLLFLLVSVASIGTYFSWDDTVEAKVYSKYVVDVALTVPEKRDFETMEIQLSKGLKFSSERYPDLSLVNKVALHRNDLRGGESFPIVVQGISAGEQVLNIQFFDKSHRLIDTRPVRIDFY